MSIFFPKRETDFSERNKLEAFCRFARFSYIPSVQIVTIRCLKSYDSV